MDPSISAMEYVQSGYKMPLNRLSAKGWLSVIEASLEHISSVMKYMPHIRDLKSALLTIHAWKLYDVECSAFPRVGWKMGARHWSVERNVRLIPLGSITIPQTEPENNGFGEWETQWPDVHLFISTKRRWVKLERIYVEKRGSNSSHEELRFCGMDEEELLQLVGDKLFCWPRMLMYLNQLMWKGIHEKRQHAEAMERIAEKELSEKLLRIGSAIP